jgi:hypothetical protein
VGIAIATRGRPDSTRAVADSQRWFAPCRYPIIPMNPRSLLHAPHTASISLVIFSTISPSKCIGSYIAVILYPLIRIFTLVPGAKLHVARQMSSMAFPGRSRVVPKASVIPCPPIHQVFLFPRCLTNCSVLTRRCRCLEFSAGTLTSTPHRGVCLPAAPRSRVTSISGCTTALSSTGQDRPLFRLAWVKAQISEIHAIFLLHNPSRRAVCCAVGLHNLHYPTSSHLRPSQMGLAAASTAQTCLSCVGNMSHVFKSQHLDRVSARAGPYPAFRRTVAAMGSKVDASSGQPLEGPCGRTNDVGLVTHL